MKTLRDQFHGPSRDVIDSGKGGAPDGLWVLPSSLCEPRAAHGHSGTMGMTVPSTERVT